MQITGTIVYQDMEGGFWGIEGDDRVPYRPVNGVPGAFQKKGLRVRATVRRSDVMSAFMWGRSVELDHIEQLSKD